MAKALLVVDVQPTFCEGGELPIEGGNQVAHDIADFVAKHRNNYDLICTTQDWHISPGGHFSDQPDFVDSWPPHGLAGSANAELHPALADLNADVAVKKGAYAAAYSGFEGEDADGHLLGAILRERGITQIDVVGLAESHCVKDTAIDGVKEGLKVRVFLDLTKPVSEELGQAAREQMRRAGVLLTSSF
ncbi:MAG: isochorismatase family protein [Winkia neuii]|uniref:nicotinamidase n=1 Tax=Winkia neuii TaxID=33007 RepID=A0A2I1INB2_9ACTO|nr:isochorismatase family protein [Winkia neuii]OFJ71846.1 nicotinamidase [Actinomyces sp. HMSC064C12]OFK01019.1 nicotinamidase [Actinomyces sp. HMSC072A03]OFT55959.1 nicotinamidase [Actinomyces sp. HMSC06A08]KWZ72860.1 isochorismatase family protein [Winkia neuii]MDK8099154.1 isochorismatase family protein [Winkia neuii]